MNRFHLLVLVILLFPLSSQAQWNSDTRRVFDLMGSGKPGQARSALSSVPESNYLRPYLNAYIDFVEANFWESKEAYNSLIGKVDERVKTTSELTPAGPYKKFLQGELYTQAALLHFRFNERWNGFWAMRNAYRLLNENHQSYPDFIPDNRSFALYKGIAGTLPSVVQWGINLLSGPEGDFNEADKLFREALNTEYENIWKKETEAMYAMYLLHLKNEEEKAWEVIRPFKTTSPDLQMVSYLHIAFFTGHNESILDVTEHLSEKSIFPVIYYFRGQARLRKLDLDRAKNDLLLFLQIYPGQNFVKDTYQKLAWIEFLKNREGEYRKYTRRVLQKGVEYVDQDKQAEKFVKEQYELHPILLKAQLLFDGGYYQKSLELLLDNHHLITTEFKKEYSYRLGRAFHKSGLTTLALEKYQDVISHSDAKDIYYTCASYLFMGQIHEKLGDRRKAMLYYELCLDTDPEIYEHTLHQKAKSGLKRIKD